jgi:hypothetical protein
MPNIKTQIPNKSQISIANGPKSANGKFEIWILVIENYLEVVV